VKILLDTHIWIWSIMAPEKLGSQLRRKIQDVRSDLFLSPISIWEAERALERKTYRLSIPFHRWVEQAYAQYHVTEAVFNFVVAEQAASLVLPQSDPGDLFIAATAIVHGLTLATADEQLLACRTVKTIPNN